MRDHNHIVMEGAGINRLGLLASEQDSFCRQAS